MYMNRPKLAREVREISAAMFVRVPHGASGRLVRLHSYSLFVSLNSRRAELGLPQFDLPPAVPVFSPNPAGMPLHRPGEATEAVLGVGSARSRSWQGGGPEMSQGADNLTKSTQATSSGRLTEPNWQTFLRAIDSVSG